MVVLFVTLISAVDTVYTTGPLSAFKLTASDPPAATVKETFSVWTNVLPSFNARSKSICVPVTFREESLKSNSSA